MRLKAPLAGKVFFGDLVKGKIAVDVVELDDMVIRRADGMPTYNMAVVVDDQDMGITYVIRGDEHVSSTPRQILIYEALGLPVPRFGHVPITDKSFPSVTALVRLSNIIWTVCCRRLL